MKKRKMMLIMAVLLFSAVSVLFVSCQEPEKAVPEDKKEEVTAEKDDGSLIEAYMSIIEDKAITVTVPDEVAAYQYKATPLFSVESTEGDGKIFGEQKTWRNFAVSTDGKRLATMGYYRQGYWRFEIRTLNKQGQVLATGTTQETGDVYLQKGKDNIINVTLHTDDGEGREGENESTGQILFGFETNWLSDSQQEEYVRLEVDKLTTSGEIDMRVGYHAFTFPLQNGTENVKPAGNGYTESYATGAVTGYQDGWTTVLPGLKDTAGILVTQAEGFAQTVPEGRIRFYARTPDWVEEEVAGSADGEAEGTHIVYKGGITAGNYIVRAKVCTVDKDTGNEIVIGGQSMAVRVIGGEKTYVTGSLLLERYQKASLSITLPDNVEGSLSTSGTDEAFVLKADADQVTGAFPTDKYITLTYTADDINLDYSRLTYQWRVNGIVIANETARTLKFTPSGWGDMKITCIVSGKTGTTGNLGEISSATMVVRVIEESGPNI